MARSIEFLAPVEAMRGNLSGNQKLTYPTQNNAAFEAPNTGRVYANNYQTRYIGAKRSSDGKKYFAVKQRSAYYSTEAGKLRNALLGGSGALIAAMMKNASFETVYRPGYEYAKANGLIPSSWSLRKYMTDAAYNYLKQKSNVVKFFNQSGSSIFVRNPWVFDTQMGAQVIPVGNFTLVKFWPQLATNPIEFDIEGLTGVAHQGDNFAKLIQMDYNVLNLTTQEVGSTDYVKMGERWLQTTDPDEPDVDWSYVEDNDPISPKGSDYIYRLVDEAPTA